jgi:hypothetical protein
MDIEPWQMPLLVMAILAVLTAVYSVVANRVSSRTGGGRRPGSNPTEGTSRTTPENPGLLVDLREGLRKYFRTSTLAVLTVILLVVGLGIVGPPISDRVTTLATSLTGLIGAVATALSYRYEKTAPERPASEKEPAPRKEPATENEPATEKEPATATAAAPREGTAGASAASEGAEPKE